jgi:hypothetical protein
VVVEVPIDPPVHHSSWLVERRLGEKCADRLQAFVGSAKLLDPAFQILVRCPSAVVTPGRVPA